MTTFMHWAEQQPERIALRATNHKLEQEYRRLDIDARSAMFKVVSLFGASEKIDDARTEWEVSSETEDNLMTKIYGINPEMMVDGYKDVVEVLQAEAYKQAAIASELFNSARSKEQEYKASRAQHDVQTEELKTRYETLQQQQTK